jgi:hypothetical protein
MAAGLSAAPAFGAKPVSAAVAAAENIKNQMSRNIIFQDRSN